jgi:hypothetical protein
MIVNSHAGHVDRHRTRRGLGLDDDDDGTAFDPGTEGRPTSARETRTAGSATRRVLFLAMGAQNNS